MAYSVKMDTDENGSLEYYNIGYQQTTRLRVIGVSYGPDRTQSDPELIETQTFDDIFSWADIPKKSK
jgi:hypothetical protein